MLKDALAYIEQRGWRGNLGGRKDVTVCFPKNYRLRKICQGNFFVISSAGFNYDTIYIAA